MALYFISYDLRNQRDYQTLYDELERYEGVRVLESVWCVRITDANHATVRDYFAKFIDADDGLLVIGAQSWATLNVDNTPLNF